jgi:hypothetical protein
MPGSKSAFEALADWHALTLEETGGFAGLRRGCQLQRVHIDAATAARVAHLLDALGPPRPAAARALPDAQQLRLEAVCGPGVCAWVFDAADLPEAADALLDLVPPLKPLPPR